MKPTILKSIVVLLLAVVSPVFGQSGNLPDPDPAVFKEHSPKELLQLSFAGVNRKNIRAYLAKHQPETPEGAFCKAWMADNAGKPAEAVTGYSELLKNRNLWPGLRAVTANNRVVSAGEAKSDQVDEFVREAIKTIFDSGYLSAASNLSGLAETQLVFLEMAKAHPALIQEQRAAWLLREAKANRFPDKYPKMNRIVEELWKMDLAEWKGDFNFELLVSMRTQKAAVGEIAPEKLLLADGFAERLLRYAAAMNESKDPVRRAIVAGWCIAYANALKAADTRYNRFNTAAAQFVFNSGGSGAAFLYPSGSALVTLRSLWDGAREGAELTKRGAPGTFTMPELAAALENHDAPEDAGWNLERGIVLCRLGKREAARAAFVQAARGAFHPDERAALLDTFANEWSGTFLYDTAAERRQLEALLPRITPGYRYAVLHNLAQLSYRAADLPGARKWLEEYQRDEKSSKTLAADELETLESLERSLAESGRYSATNPLEAKWQEQHGRQGISVQLNFATNSHQLPADTEAKLAPILSVLDDGTFRNLIFRLEGHSDNTGSDAINNPLSLRRAESLAGYLEQQKGVARGRLEVEGFGPRRPMASNLTDTGKAVNRRVELNLLGDAGRPALVASGAMSNVISAASPDGRMILTGSGDVWDTRDWVRLYGAPDMGWEALGAVFSPDNRWLFIASKKEFFNLGLLLDARSGVMVGTVPCPTYRGINFPTWSPDSKQIAFSSGSTCFIYDIASRKFAGSVPTSISRGLPQFSAWIKGGSALAVLGQSGGTQLSLIDVRTLALQEIAVPELGWAHHMASSHDGRFLYITDDTGAVLDWDTLNAPRPRRHQMWNAAISKGQRFAGKSISVHPGNPQRIAVNCMHAKNWGVVDFAAGTVSANKSTRMPTAVWGADGTEILVSGGWVANEASRRAGAATETGIYRASLESPRATANNEVLEFIKGPAASLNSLQAFESLKLAVAFGKGNISVWDVTTGRQAHQWPDTANYYSAAPQEQPGVFYGILVDEVQKESRLVRYDLNDFRRTELAVLAGFKVSSFEAGAKIAAIGGGPFAEPRKGAEELELRVVDLASGKVLKKQAVPALTEKLVYGTLELSSVHWLELSPSGEEIAFVTKWQDGYGYGTKNSKEARRWRWKEGQMANPAVSANAIESISYESDTLLRVTSSRTYSDSVYDLAAGKWTDQKLPRATRPNRRCVTGLDKAFEDLNLKLTFSSRGEIRFNRRDTGETVLTVLKKGEEWIAYNAQGNYAASSGGAEKVFWRVGSRMLPIESMREKLEQPALVAESLKAIFEKRIVQRPDVVKPVVSPELFDAPYEVKVLSATGIETKEPHYTMKVQIKALTPEAPEPELVWTVNGMTPRGFKVVPAKVEPRVFQAEHQFELAAGSNEFTVSLRYKDAVILPQTVRVTRAVPKKTPAAVAGGTHLWFFGVGVKDYAKADQNLDYPDKDVRELERMLLAQKGLLYGEVHTKTLTNAAATVKDIKVEMNRFLKQASSQDVLVIMLAGHGVVGTDQELYFVAHDSDASEAYTGLELRAFAQFLERRPPTQKAVFLMDICHAGAFGQTSKRRGGGVTSEEAVRLLEEGTGTVVLASSTGREASLEDEKFRGGHGAFTAALLDGLEGKADAATGQSDGYISLLELTSYVSREVPKLTSGAQHPITPRMENVRDFPLGKRR